MSLEESESSLEGGSDESYFLFLRWFFFLFRFFFFDDESDDGIFYDEYDSDGSGSGLSGTFFFIFWEFYWLCQWTISI